MSQNIRVISFGNGRTTAQVVRVTGSGGRQTSRTFHLHLMAGTRNTYGSKPDSKGNRELVVDLK